MPGWMAPVPRDPACHACPHPHHILPCDFDTALGTCTCVSDYQPGIDTALGG